MKKLSKDGHKRANNKSKNKKRDEDKQRKREHIEMMKKLLDKTNYAATLFVRKEKDEENLSQTISNKITFKIDIPQCPQTYYIPINIEYVKASAKYS